MAPDSVNASFLETEEPVISVKEKKSLGIGITTWVNQKNGFRVLDLEYKADPDKRSDEWKISSQSGTPKAQWNREYGPNWVVYDGKGVYADYDEDIHVAKGNIIVPRRSKLISGWDGGPMDVHLAWTLGVVTPGDFAVLIIDELYYDDGDIYGFVEAVASRLQLEWIKLGGFSIHIADQSIFNNSGVVKGGKAMADVMREFGMNPIPGEISFAKRRNTLIRLMRTLHKVTGDENKMVPKFRVHERCTFLREALNGGYAYPKTAGGVGEDYGPKPIKNRWSHIANSCEYLTSRPETAVMPVKYENRRLPSVSLSF